MSFGDTGGGAPPAGGGNNGGGYDWTSIVNALIKGYGAYQSTRPTSFQKAPEDPSLTALRQQLLGYMQNSPTRNMLGSMLGSRLEAANNSSFSLPQSSTYNPNAGYVAPKYDMKAIMGSIATPQNPQAGSQPNGASAMIPPPPPEGHQLSKKEKINHRAKGILGGLVSGVVGGPFGAIAGALGGGAASRSKDKQADAQYQQAYNEWLKQWGPYFGTSVPRNMNEYKAWYQQKYGRPYTGS